MQKLRLFLLAGLLLGTTFFTQAQSQTLLDSDSLKEAPKDWWHSDPEATNLPGINTDKAYDFLKGRTSNKVLVAVIDSGIDIEHEDLRDVIWINSDEVAGNGIDDDGNGYVDDVHGWNFLGGENGKSVERDTYELTREYLRLQEKYQGMATAAKEADEEWAYYQKIEREYESTVRKMQTQYAGFKGFYDQYKKAERLLLAYLDLKNLNKKDLSTWDSPDPKITRARDILMTAFDNGLDSEQMDEGIDYFTTALEYGYNLDFNPRTVIGDDITDPYERIYGNNDVAGEFSFHGTHVAGIIAASRGNKKGIDGVADNVEIMVLRAVPNGDERDKDVANAIIYAVDNGAQIVNMSFGKRFSPHKEAVDKAIKYAESKGVLLIHAAGNSSHDTEKIEHFPTPKLAPQVRASNWLEVGAVSWKGEEVLVATFSNYGKTTVDVFAPGVDIFSTAPEQAYKNASGTSMAAPVTTGVAALIMSYYPTLSATEVRDILLKSSTGYQNQKVKVPGKEETTKFGQLSQTGGVINAYEAVKLAQKARPSSKKLKRD